MKDGYLLQMLAQSHGQDIEGIGFLIPGIDVADHGPDLGTSIAIRGITTQAAPCRSKRCYKLW
jgi:hypothetical protein